MLALSSGCCAFITQRICGLLGLVDVWAKMRARRSLAGALSWTAVGSPSLGPRPGCSKLRAAGRNSCRPLNGHWTRQLSKKEKKHKKTRIGVWGEGRSTVVDRSGKVGLPRGSRRPPPAPFKSRRLSRRSGKIGRLSPHFSLLLLPVKLFQPLIHQILSRKRHGSSGPTSTGPGGVRSDLKTRCFVHLLQMAMKLVVILKLRCGFEREEVRVCGVLSVEERRKDVMAETGSD